MDPNVTPQQPQYPQQQPITPSEPARQVPDWQQGLIGAPQPQQGEVSLPGTTIPIEPAQPGMSLPTNMPAAQSYEQYGQPPQPVAAPATEQAVPPSNPWQQQPAPQQPQFVPPAPVYQASSAPTDSPTSKGKQRLIVAIVGVVVLALLAVLTVFMFHKKTPKTATTGDSANSAAQQSKSNAPSTAQDLATLNSVKFTIPADMKGYDLQTSTSTDAIKDYASSDRLCELIVGTAPESTLPGADLNAIVKPQLDQLTAAGATITGPNAGQALTLNAVGSSTQYSMPTLIYTFAEGAKHATVHYSAVILQDGSRAVISRTCVNANGTVDASKLVTLDAKAAQVTVVKQ